MILLDTHALVWMDADDPALGKTSRRLIQQAWETENLAVSAISFWECAMLQQRERLILPMPAHAWRMDLIAAGLQECPLHGEIAILAAQLEFLHKDPADRFITATAMVHSATLVTADERLLAWTHRLKRQDARR
jgi:PIN domain nuclease of toxin-antitoxin system